MKPKDGFGIQEKPFQFLSKQELMLTSQCFPVSMREETLTKGSALWSWLVTTGSLQRQLSCFGPRNTKPSSSEIRAQQFRPRAATERCTYENTVS